VSILVLDTIGERLVGATKKFPQIRINKAVLLWKQLVGSSKYISLVRLLDYGVTWSGARKRGSD